MTTSRITEAIRASCVARPLAVAIIGQHLSMSYGELLRALDSAVGTLRSAGVSRGDVVEVRAERDGRLPLAVLSVWEVGAAAAIVNATLPPAYLNDCEAVVQPRWRLTLADGAGFTVARRDGSAGAETDASHILFTSGSTGRPAAVEVGRGALHRILNWYLSAFSTSAADRVALLSGVGHDPMLRDVLVPLMSGGTLVVPPDDVFSAPDRLLSFIRDAGVTILHCTPALLELIIAALCPSDRGALGGVRLVVSAGAVLHWGTLRRLRAVTNAVIVNAYGSTETPQIASCEVVSAVRAACDRHLPNDASLGIGSGVGGSELLIVDGSGRIDDVPRGEIVVRSRNLARRYLSGTGRDDRFIADPRGVPGYRAYRTGDLGERGKQGTIRIVGRIDRQMSINGFRIEPKEIEKAAMRHPAVTLAVAAPICAPTGDLIELSVVPTAPDGVDARTLRSFLRSSLPSHAVPSRIRIMTGTTLDANHKLKLW